MRLALEVRPLRALHDDAQARRVHGAHARDGGVGPEQLDAVEWGVEEARRGEVPGDEAGELSHVGSVLRRRARSDRSEGIRHESGGMWSILARTPGVLCRPQRIPSDP